MLMWRKAAQEDIVWLSNLSALVGAEKNGSGTEQWVLIDINGKHKTEGGKHMIHDTGQGYCESM